MILIVPAWLVDIAVIGGGAYALSLLGAGAYVVLAAVFAYYLLRFSWWMLKATITADWRTFYRNHFWNLFWGVPCTLGMLALLFIAVPAAVFGVEYLARSTIVSIIYAAVGVVLVTCIPLIVRMEKSNGTY